MEPLKSYISNGIRLIVASMPSLESATVTVWVGTGSRYEESRLSGLSHFLEHMVFKGSRKRPSAKAISEAVDSIGGEFNASTSKEWTNCYIKARVANFETVFDVLSDMVIHPLLKKADIEREKGVIVEEIGMYEDTPLYRISDVFERIIFDGSSLQRDILGTKDTVTSIRRSDFEDYRAKFYYPENIVVTVSGGVNEAEIKKLTEKYFGKLDSAKLGKLQPDKFINKQVRPQVILHSKKKDQAHLVLGFLGNPKGHPDRFAESLLAAILGGGMSSRLFLSVREKRGLAYAIKTSTDHYKDTGYLATYAGVDVKRIDEAIKVMLNEHYKLITNHKSLITTSELSKAKEFIKGHLALSLEDTREVNQFFGVEELALGKVLTPEEVFRKIDRVEVKDVIRVARDFFKPERLNLAIIGPYKDQKRFEKLLYRCIDTLIQFPG